MNVLSLFAGIGGLDLGLERAGMTVVGQVEIDPYCQSVLAKHWPEVPRHDDVRTTPEWWTAKPRPSVDVVCGGFPCQPFSTAGLRGGVGDERWGWPWMFNVIRAVRPSYVIVENVAALLRDADAFGWMLADLAAGGFDAQWSVLSACTVGAPHTRERLFAVAHTNSVHGPERLGGNQHDHPPLRSADWWATSGTNPIEQAMAAQCRADGVANGLAAGMVTAGGNAVVPQVAEHIGRLITGIPA